MNAEVAPSLRMISAVLDHVETFFIESGCPLSDEQTDALLGAKDACAQQVSQIRGAA